MHVGRLYTIEQATDMFNTTRAFMRRLAEELRTRHGIEEEESENAAGSGDSRSEAQGRDARSSQGGEGQGITAPPQPEEEVGRTSTGHRSEDCTAKHTRSDRTEDA